MELVFQPVQHIFQNHTMIVLAIFLIDLYLTKTVILEKTMATVPLVELSLGLDSMRLSAVSALCLVEAVSSSKHHSDRSKVDKNRQQDERCFSRNFCATAAKYVTSVVREKIQKFEPSFEYNCEST